MNEQIHDLDAWLRTQGAWQAEQLEQAHAQFEQERLLLIQSLKGLRIYLDSEGFLVWENFPDGKVLERYPLTANQAPVTNKKPVSQRALLWLEPETGRQIDLYSLPADQQMGLIVTAKNAYLHSAGLESAPLLAQSNIWVDTALPDNRVGQVDLQVLPERELLFVLQRAAGTVKVFDLYKRNLLASWQIRGPGSSLAINLSFARSGLKAYLTDNLTPQLWIADLVNFELKVWKSGLGVLGNLLAAPEPGYLYLTVLNPHFNLITFDLDAMAAEYSIEIRGEPLTNRQLLAWDPFMAAPDGQLLFYLAAREHGEQILPVLNVIDTQEVRTIKRSIVRSSVFPVSMVSGAENPIRQYHQLDFKTWLIEKGFITEADLKRPPAVELRASKTQNPRVDLYQPPAEDANIWNLLDQPAPLLELPPEAEDVIVDLICWAFYRLTLTNLSVHSGEIQLLKKLAGPLRHELQTREAVLAKLTDILGRFDFQTPIARRDVLALLGQPNRFDLSSLEARCPICQGQIADHFCQDCAYRLDLPESERLKPLSAEPATALLAGQMLIPHPVHAASLSLNLWGELLTVVTAPELKSLSHVVSLPNQNLLAVDSLGNKLVELSLTGEVLWKARLALKKPVMASWYTTNGDIRYLLVDQGNARVLELDASGKNWRRYPTLKTPLAAKLTAPTDVQLTPELNWLISDPAARRVLEVDPKGQIVNQWGPEQGLNAPYMARRQADGSTEILDLSQGRIWRFLVNQLIGFFDYAAQISESQAPDWACLVHNGEWLLLGRQKLWLISAVHQVIRRVLDIPEALSSPRSGFSVHTGADIRKKQLSEFASQLRRIELFARESDDGIETLARHVQLLTFDAGDWLLYPGELGNALFFVQSGVLEMIAPEKEQPVIFDVLPSESCGTQSVLSLGQTAWRPGIRVKQDCLILMLERSEFKKAVVSFPRLFHLVRQLDLEHQRRFKLFRERKIEFAQDQLRARINETQIRNFALFAGAQDHFFEALAESVQAVAFLPDKFVCQRGESGGTVYFILDGSVAVIRRGESHSQIILTEGDVFGEMSVVFDQPRTASVMTQDYCKFFVLEEAPLRALCKRFPWLWERLADLARQRQAANAEVWSAFESAAGLARRDLPQVNLPTGPRDDEQLLFVPSLNHDAIVGMNQSGAVLWFWGHEPSRQLFHPERVLLLDQSLLVVDTGNNRVLEIDIATRKTRRKWSGHLKQPSSAVLTPEGLLLVADEGHQRLVVIDESGREVWQYGLPEEILSPRHIEITPSGTLLFADAGMHRVYELSLDGRVLWTHGKWRSAGTGLDQLNQPSWVSRLASGVTLIADTGNQRLVWLEPGAEPRLIQLSQLGETFYPRHCQRLSEGDLMVFDGKSDRLVRVNRRGDLIWEASLDYPERVFSYEPIFEPNQPEAQVQDRWNLAASIFDAPENTERDVETSSDGLTEALPAPESPELTEAEKRIDEMLAFDPLETTQRIFWQELGLDIPKPELEMSQPRSAVLPELLPDLHDALDEVLEQVSEDLEVQAEQKVEDALAYLTQLEGLETGVTLIVRGEKEADQHQVSKTDDMDFLDQLMSGTEPEGH